MNNVKVVVTVSELDGEGGTLGEAASVTRPLQKKAAVEIRGIVYKSYYSIMDEIAQKVNEYCAEQGMSFGSYDIDAIDSMPEEDQLRFGIMFLAMAMKYYPELVEMASASKDNADGVSDQFDYIIYIPVRNIGNKMANITADVTYVTDELDDT